MHTAHPAHRLALAYERLSDAISADLVTAIAALDAAAARAIEQLYEAQEALRIELYPRGADVSDAVVSHLEGAREHAGEVVSRAALVRQEIRWAQDQLDAEARGERRAS